MVSLYIVLVTAWFFMVTLLENNAIGINQWKQENKNMVCVIKIMFKLPYEAQALMSPNVKSNNVPHICHGHSSLNVYLCGYVFLFVCVLVHACMRFCMCMCTSACACVCVCTFVFLYMCVCGWLCRGSRSWRPRCIALCSRSSQHARPWPSR